MGKEVECFVLSSNVKKKQKNDQDRPSSSFFVGGTFLFRALSSILEWIEQLSTYAMINGVEIYATQPLIKHNNMDWRKWDNVNASSVQVDESGTIRNLSQYSF